MKCFLPILTVFIAGCVSNQTPKTQIVRELGRHHLPFQPNERFVLQSVDFEPSSWTFGPATIVYFLDGRRRQMRLGGKGTTDGYVTDMGRLLANETEGVESPIMDERVILLATGEEITIVGNTIDQGGIRLRTTKSAVGHTNSQPAE